MDSFLKILYLENDLMRLRLVQQQFLNSGLAPEWHHLSHGVELKEAVEGADWDVVLSAYPLLDLNKTNTLRTFEPWLEEQPWILICERTDAESAIPLLQQGVQDVIVTDHLMRLVPALKRSLKDAAFRRALRQAERLQALSAEVLRILNDPQALSYATRQILSAIKRATGIESVGIRLRQGHDFPYAVSEGFSDDFLQAENSLAVRLPDGQFCLDEQGKVRLECTCGLVLSGQADPSNPLFTPGGSAWTNDARPFLKVPLELDPRLHPRNRCIHEGYQSVALIPIRVEDEIVGLLQLNDRRQHCFTLEMIQYFEGLAASLGVALLRLKEEEVVRQSHRILRSLFDAIPESLFLMTLEGVVQAANTSFAARFGRRVDDCIGASLFQLVPSHLVESRRTWIAEVVRTCQPVVNEEQWGERWLRHSYCPVFNREDQVEQVVVLALDITEQKAAEVERLRNEKDLKESQRIAHLGSWRLDLATNQVCWTEELYKMLGFDPSLPPPPYTEHMKLFTPESWALLSVSLERTNNTGLPYELELEMIKGDSRLGWMWVRGEAVKDAEGKIIGLWGAAQDITERKLSEIELERTRNLLIEAQQIAHLGSWEYIAATRETVWSTEQKRIYGLDPAAPSPHYLEMLSHHIHPDDAGELDRGFEAAFRAHAMFENENRIVRPDGSIRWILNRAHPHFNGDGKLLKYVGTTLDITERKLAEAAVRESEQRLRLALDAARMGTFDWDIPNNRLAWSFWHEVLWNYQPGEFDGSLEAFYRRIHPEDMAEVNSQMSRCRTNRETFKHEFRVVWPDGSIHWIAGTGQYEFDTAGQATRMRGTVVEITERKQSESELREKRNLLRDVGRMAKIGGWEFDVTTGEGSWTEEVAQIHDMDPHQRPNKDLGISFYRGDSRLQIQAAVRRTIAEGKPYDLELEIVSEKGVHKWVRTIGEPDWKNGRVVKLRGAIQDITERKVLEQQLRQTQKLESIGQLAGGIAHDFNNILAAIMMQLSLAEMSPALDADLRHTLEDLGAEAKRAANLTRQLLMFSRRSVLSMKPLDLSEVIENLLKMLGRLIGENIAIRHHGTGPLPKILADSGMMEQVLMNLAVNARDAMTKGGRIDIRTTHVILGTADTEMHPDRRPGHFICLAVSDTGCGMDAAILKKIFEPFFTTKETGKGTGLGLATVHGIVAQHQGWVEVESTVGQGSTFRVYLPAMVQSVKEMDETRQAESLKGGQETILLVEDEANLRRTLGQGLRVLGYGVLEAGNGQEAMTVWQQHSSRIDLLLTDMVMPEGMTGMELAEQLHAEKPKLRVIISSGYSTEMAKLGTVGDKGFVFLPKPYEITTLATVVRRCLDEPSTHNPAGG